MRRGLFIAIAGVLCLIVCVALVLERNTEKRAVRHVPQGASNVIVLPNSPSNSSSFVRDIKLKIPLLKKVEEIKIMAEKQNVPINFWGKVVDQDEHPVSDVSVKAQVSSPEVRNLAYGTASFHEYNLKTDPNGLFALINARGDILTVTALEKENYRSPPVFQKSFEYGVGQKFIASSNQPFVFKLLDASTLTDEPVVQFNRRSTIRCDGTPISINTLNNDWREGADSIGDIWLSFVRDPVNLVEHSTNYSWALTIEIPSGGLICSDEDYFFLTKAPERGYVSSYRLSMERSDPNWKRERKLPFYFQLQNGKDYGRAMAEIYTWYQGERTAIVIEGCVNQSGGRVVEKRSYFRK